MNRNYIYYLQHALRKVDPLIQYAVEYAQKAEQTPADTLRGLVVSEEEISSILDKSPMSGLWGDDHHVHWQPILSPDDEQEGHPFPQLVATFQLSDLDAYILLLCLAPELDRRYERVFAYLQDDISQRRVTVNLLMNLLGATLDQRFAVWERLQLAMPLRERRLLTTHPNPDKPNAGGLAHTVQVAPRVVQHLLGQAQPDDRLRDALLPPAFDQQPDLPATAYAHLLERLPHSPMVYIKGRPGMGQASTVAALCAAHEFGLVRLDAAKLRTEATPFDEMWRLAIREAALQQAALLLENWQALFEPGATQPHDDFWQALQAHPYPVFLSGDKDWEPTDTHRQRPLLRVELDVPAFPARLTAWEQLVSDEATHISPEALKALAHKFRLSREQIARAVRSAWDVAASRDDALCEEDLYAGVQAQISLQLGHLADRISPRYTWDDLILPPDQLQQLWEITDRARFAHQVHNEWGFGKRIPNGGGVSALFAGESGTGKTLSVHVIANELGLALYRIDLSAVVSKYIGETEKNLSVIFTEARASNAILFFDEADAIFGKRSEVKDARDRYANIEIAYLLQQIEDYDGVAIMATNLRQNLDEAFTRRLDFMVDFPFPDETYRERLWEAHFPPEAPLHDAIDVTQLAQRYRLSGGNIRNAALASAFLAAADGGIITMQHVRSAVRREHQKMGRLLEEL